jgi:hypothetical protein
MQRALAALAGLVAVLGGLAAGLGVFGRGSGTFVSVRSALGERYEIAVDGVYADSGRQLVAEGVGWDVVTLLVAAPVLLVAAAFVVRGSFRGTLVATGMLGYFVYLHLEYGVTWSFGPLFPLFVVVLALSALGLLVAAATLADAGLAGRFDERFPRRRYAALTLGMSALLTVMWAARIAEALGAEVATLHGETTMTVQVLDLGLLVPISIVVAVGVVRRSPAAMAAAAAFGVTFVAMTAAIAAMMVSASIVTDELQLPPIVLFGLAALAGLVVVARILASAADRRVPRPADRARWTTPVPAPG